MNPRASDSFQDTNITVGDVRCISVIILLLGATLGAEIII